MLPSNVEYDEADYEVELALVIGRQCKNVSVAEAADYILGYSVANDVTARKHQDKTSQWSYAKGMVCCSFGMRRQPDLLTSFRMDSAHWAHALYLLS